MNKLIKVFIVLLIGILLPISYVLSYDPSSTTTFSGPNHAAGCHSNTYTFSSVGIVTISINSGTIINPGDKFDISVTINGFIEAAGNNISLGFSNLRSDNKNFEFTPSYLNVSVNSSGNAITQVFTALAPTTEGKYVITIDALDDPEGTGADPLEWTYGSIEITVSNSTGNADNLLQSIIIIAGSMSGVGILTVQIFLSSRFLKRSRISKNRDLIVPKKE